ncbi:MAG TPA: hypothetical protein VGN31_12950 [Paraburkholderia sp.]
MHDRFNAMNYFAFSIWKYAEIRRLMRCVVAVADDPKRRRSGSDQTDARRITTIVRAGKD